MKNYFATIAMMTALVSPAMADSDWDGARPVDTYECTQLAVKVLAVSKAEVVRMSPSSIFFKVSNFEFQLSCVTHDTTGVDFGWNNSAYPPGIWYAMASAIGFAVTGESMEKLDKAARKCIGDAVSGKSAADFGEEMSAVELPKAHLECQGYKRDGGGANLSIFIMDAGIRKQQQTGLPSGGAP